MEQILEHRGEKGRRLVVFLDNVSATSDLAERGSTCRADGSELRPGLAQCAALEQPRKAACPSGLTAAPVAQEALEFGTVDRGPSRFFVYSGSISAPLRLLHQVGEDGAAHFDCVGDRDRKAAELWLPS